MNELCYGIEDWLYTLRLCLTCLLGLSNHRNNDTFFQNCSCNEPQMSKQENFPRKKKCIPLKYRILCRMLRLLEVSSTLQQGKLPPSVGLYCRRGRGGHLPMVHFPIIGHCIAFIFLQSWMCVVATSVPKTGRTFHNVLSFLMNFRLVHTSDLLYRP